MPIGLIKIKNKAVNPEKFVITAHHEFMKAYGWIPLEEFRKLPIPTFWNLWERIIEDKKNGKKYGRQRNI